MLTRSSFLTVLLVASSATADTPKAPAPAPTKPAIVLVHGAFADAMAWAKVIPTLQKDGYNVVAVEQPLTSFDEDVAAVKRGIDAGGGPVVLVGHSYGGAVITAAAAGNANVKALVYVAAFAPDAGEPVAAFLDKYPAPLGKALKPDAAGFLSIDHAQLHDCFAADLSKADTDLMAVTQKPVAAASLGAKPAAAAWKTIPSWYMVATQDKAINPDLERFYAKRMKATTVEVAASHVPFLSKPDAVVKLIEQAATAKSK